MEDLSFSGSDPGAVRFGNFINYYQFHHFNARIMSLPKNIWQTEVGSDFICLDIGCNSGELTQALYEFISSNLVMKDKDGNNCCREKVHATRSECYFLGIDLDPVLIERAMENNKFETNVLYQPLNFMSDEKENILNQFQKHHYKDHFDVIFCFSVTMWIHLNYGDVGLLKFLKDICSKTSMLVIEPQPWKCYRTAVRRLKRSAGETFAEFENLKIKNNVEYEIDSILQNECHFVKIVETSPGDWGRKISFYEKAQ